MANPLLDAAIAEYSIPRWPYEATYDRIVVFSLPEAKSTRDTYIEGGSIVMPETKKAREQAMSPRGVICSAGLGARDVLRSHGMGLGHVVWVARLSPWRHEVEITKEGKVIEFLFLRVGDVVGSETLQRHIARQLISIDVRTDGTHAVKYIGGADEDALPRFDPPSYVA